MSAPDDTAPRLAPVPFATLDTVRRARPRLVVDLRSPVEFEDDHVKGALNVPLFENETRAFVGLLYKQFSPDAAFNEARAEVVQRIEEIVGRIAAAAGWDVPAVDLKERVRAMTSGGIARMETDLDPVPLDELPEDAVVLSCARGGLRSRSIVALLRTLGLEAVGLIDGYRAHRSHVREALEAWTPPPHVFALRGLTGVGKTLVLRAIEERRPGWTLDLEGIAGHRSSLLGMVGLRQTTQKGFEGGLVLRAEEGFPQGVLVMEGESRKVGDVVIPKSMWKALQGAVNVEIVASVARRVRVLSEDYLAVPESLPKLREQLVAVAARMDGEPDLAGMFDRGEIDPLVELLLERYYDPLYRGSEAGKRYEATVEAEDASAAADEIVRWIEARIGA